MVSKSKGRKEATQRGRSCVLAHKTSEERGKLV